MAIKGTKQDRKLTAQQKRFAENYAISMNATQSALAAGYSKNGASVRGANLLKISRVQDYILSIKAQQLKETDTQAKRVLSELEKVAFFDIRDYVEETEGGGVQLKALAEMKNTGVIKKIKIKVIEAEGAKVGEMVEIEFFEKLKALDALARHNSLFTTNVAQGGGDAGGGDNYTQNNFYITHRK